MLTTGFSSSSRYSSKSGSRFYDVCTWNTLVNFIHYPKRNVKWRGRLWRLRHEFHTKGNGYGATLCWSFHRTLVHIDTLRDSEETSESFELPERRLVKVLKDRYGEQKNGKVHFCFLSPHNKRQGEQLNFLVLHCNAISKPRFYNNLHKVSTSLFSLSPSKSTPGLKKQRERERKNLFSGHAFVQAWHDWRFDASEKFSHRVVSELFPSLLRRLLCPRGPVSSVALGKPKTQQSEAH